METVYSLVEAQEWFLNHSSGSVICYKGTEMAGVSKVCSNYQEAVQFYN